MGANRQSTKSSGMVYILYIIYGIYIYGIYGSAHTNVLCNSTLAWGLLARVACCQLENLLVGPQTKPPRGSNQKRIERKLRGIKKEGLLVVFRTLPRNALECKLSKDMKKVHWKWCRLQLFLIGKAPKAKQWRSVLGQFLWGKVSGKIPLF